MNKKILLVEDDDELAELVQDYLKDYNFDVEIISDGAEAVKNVLALQPVLVILDVMLPNMSGMDICREVRSSYKGPILMLTALDDDIDQMLGLELGADDYIIKPIQPRLLLTRIRTLLRRVDGSLSSSNSSSIQIGELKINLSKRTVSIYEKNIELTSAEYELLLLLAQDAGQVVERDTILMELRGYEYDGFDRSIDRRISRLRRKLASVTGSNLIKTVRGKGYQLCVE